MGTLYGPFSTRLLQFGGRNLLTRGNVFYRLPITSGRGEHVIRSLRSELPGRGPRPSPHFLFVEGKLSVQAISWVIDQSKHKGNTFVVLLMIANHAKSDGTGAWPSIHTLAKESRLSDRTVQRCIKRLSLHWKKIWPPELLVRSGKGPYGSNLYDIPGVKLSPPGDKTGREGVSDTVTTPVTQLSHPIRHLTVSKDKRVPPSAAFYDPGKFNPERKVPIDWQEMERIKQKYPDLA